MSFGGGVQSTAIAMLAINRDERLLCVTEGLLPELYIFADTGDEPRALYPHIEMMKARIEASGATFKTTRAPVGSLSENTIRAARNGFKRADTLPFFVLCKDGSYAPVKRGCTTYYKIAQLKAVATRWFGVHKGKPHDGSSVEMWLGISSDEPQRLKCGPVQGQKWATYFNPLHEMRWHRADCQNYLAGLGIHAQRSACVYCPFHSKREWRAVRQVPEDWALAIEVDEALEHAANNGGTMGFTSDLFLNREGKRLRDLDLAETSNPQQRMWDNECAGVCGV